MLLTAIPNQSPNFSRLREPVLFISLGTIDQLVIDTDHGHIAYVLLLQEGLLGIDNQWIPVPYEALQWSTADQNFALDIAEDQLRPMAKLPRQNLPTDVSAAKLQHFYEPYGVTPYWQRMAQAASGSIRATVQEVNGQQGTVALQMSKGKIVEMQVPEEMSANLEADDRVEVVIRLSDETSSSGQTRRQQSQSGQSR